MEYVLKKGQSYIGGEDGNYKIICNPAQRIVFNDKQEAELCMKKIKKQGIKMKRWNIVCVGDGSTDFEDIIQTDTYVLTNGKDFIGRNPVGGISFSAPVPLVSIYHGFNSAKKALETLYGLYPGLGKYEVKTFSKALKDAMDMEFKDISSGDRKKTNPAGVHNSFQTRNGELYHDGKMHVLAERKVCNDVDEMINAFENNIHAKHREYKENLDDIEKFLVDIYHLFEFSEFKEGDEKIYRLYLLFQQTLRKRRDLKDSIEKIQKISSIREEMRNITESFKKMQGRTYVPRAVEEIFADMQSKGFVINPSRQYVEHKKNPAKTNIAARVVPVQKCRKKNTMTTKRNRMCLKKIAKNATTPAKAGIKWHQRRTTL